MWMRPCIGMRDTTLSVEYIKTTKMNKTYERGMIVLKSPPSFVTITHTIGLNWWRFALATKFYGFILWNIEELACSEYC
jgi:hypothetical protein